MRRRHVDDRLTKRLAQRLGHRPGPLAFGARHRLAIPTARRNAQRLEQPRAPQLGLARQLFGHVLPQRRRQGERPESFFKMRLAAASSPIVSVRSSSSAFSSRISRSRTSLPLLPLASAASPAATKSSRQRYNVASLIPYRRANRAAGSSRRSNASTAPRRCSTVTSDRFGIVNPPPGRVN